MKYLFVTYFMMCMWLSHLVHAQSNILGEQSVKGLSSGVDLIAKLKAKNVPAGEPVMLTAIIENNSSNDVRLASKDRYLDCDIKVRNTQGEEIPGTRYCNMLKKKNRRTGTYVRTIRPGESYRYIIPVDLLYDISVPEKYFVQARVSVSVERKEKRIIIELQSPELEFQILRTIGQSQQSGSLSH